MDPKHIPILHLPNATGHLSTIFILNYITVMTWSKRTVIKQLYNILIQIYHR